MNEKHFFDIDSLLPLGILESLDRRKKYKYSPNEFHFKGGAYRGHGRYSPGYDHEKLLDWRACERRFNDVANKHSVYATAFWEMLKDALSRGQKSGAKEVWLPYASGEYVLVFDEDGLTSRDTKRIIDEHVGNPDKKAYVMKGAELDECFKLRERDNTWLKRKHRFCAAFRISVEERIKPFIKEKLAYDHRRLAGCFKRGVFVVENDSRTYVLSTTDYGGIEWVEKEIFISK